MGPPGSQGQQSVNFLGLSLNTKHKYKTDIKLKLDSRGPKQQVVTKKIKCISDGEVNRLSVCGGGTKADMPDLTRPDGTYFCRKQQRLESFLFVIKTVFYAILIITGFYCYKFLDTNFFVP